MLFEDLPQRKMLLAFSNGCNTFLQSNWSIISSIELLGDQPSFRCKLERVGSVLITERTFLSSFRFAHETVSVSLISEISFVPLWLVKLQRYQRGAILDLFLTIKERQDMLGSIFQWVIYLLTSYKGLVMECWTLYRIAYDNWWHTGFNTHIQEDAVSFLVTS